MCDTTDIDTGETAFNAVRAAARESVQAVVLDLKPGDILVVKLGIQNMGDGLPPWLPGPAELEYLRDELEYLIPEGVKTVVHHHGIDFSVVRNIDNAAEVWVEDGVDFDG